MASSFLHILQIYLFVTIAKEAFATRVSLTSLAQEKRNTDGGSKRHLTIEEIFDIIRSSKHLYSEPWKNLNFKFNLKETAETYESNDDIYKISRRARPFIPPWKDLCREVDMEDNEDCRRYR